MKVLNSDLFSAAIENKVHVNDLHATMLHLLGIDYEKLTYSHIGHAYRLTDVDRKGTISLRPASGGARCRTRETRSRSRRG
jgi:hypothetical protein